WPDVDGFVSYRESTLEGIASVREVHRRHVGHLLRRPTYLSHLRSRIHRLSRDVSRLTNRRAEHRISSSVAVIRWRSRGNLLLDISPRTSFPLVLLKRKSVY